MKYIWQEKEFKNIKDIDQLFDMICVRNFMAGNLGQKIPVDENRYGFKKIKDLITSPKSKL